MEQSGSPTPLAAKTYKTADLVAAFLEERWRQVGNGNLEKATVKLAEKWLSVFALAVEVTPYRQSHLRAFDKLLQKRGLSGTTRAAAFARVRTFQTWLQTDDDWRHVGATLPSFKGITPAADTKQPDVLTPQELEDVLNAAKRIPHHYCLFVIAQQTGIRPWMIRKLTWDMLKRENFKGFNTVDKKKKPSYYVAITADVMQLILTTSPTAETKEGYLFPAKDGGIMRHDTLTQIFRRHFQEAGVNKQSNGPYMLRHTYIQRVRDKYGVDVAAKLAGNSVAMVERVYGKTPNIVIEHLADKVSKELGQPINLDRQATIFDFIEPDDDENQSDYARAESKKASSRDPQNEGIPSEVKA